MVPEGVGELGSIVRTAWVVWHRETKHAHKCERGVSRTEQEYEPE